MNYCGYVNAMKAAGTIEARMAAAGRYCGLTWGNWQKVYESGKLLFELIPAHSPMTSINKDIIFDFYKNDKSEFEIVCFLAFAALRSIIQTKPYCKITNGFLLARMAGLRSSKDITRIPDAIKKYDNRYQLDKIKKELQNAWGLKLYARYTRGFYVSFKMNKYEDLVYEVEKRRKSNIEKLRKETQHQAISRANDRLFPTAP